MALYLTLYFVFVDGMAVIFFSCRECSQASHWAAITEWLFSKLMEKLFRESFIPERRKFQIVIWFLVCSIGMFLVRSSAIFSFVTDSNWCHM